MPVTQLSVRPKSLVLDLLRVAGPSAVPVSGVVRVGELFGFSGNALRVAVARLAASGLLESDERGSYRLAPGAGAVTSHVEEWRLGEKRVRRWARAWLSIWLPARPERAARRHSLRALRLMGFAEALDGLWVRPDNLASALPATAEKLTALGLEAGAEPFLASELSPRLVKSLESNVWDVGRLTLGYRETLSALERSTEIVRSMPVEQALVETFLIGGAAIRLLATDPLLPSEILPGNERRRLTDAMLGYDVVGRGVWTRALRGVRLDGSPSHLSLIEGAA